MINIPTIIRISINNPYEIDDRFHKKMIDDIFENVDESFLTITIYNLFEVSYSILEDLIRNYHNLNYDFSIYFNDIYEEEYVDFDTIIEIGSIVEASISGFHFPSIFGYMYEKPTILEYKNGILVPFHNLFGK